MIYIFSKCCECMLAMLLHTRPSDTGHSWWWSQLARLQKTTSKAKRRRNATRLHLQPSVALCSYCGAVFAPHELLPKDKRFCIGQCGIPRDLMMKQSHGGMKMLPADESPTRGSRADA